MAEVRLHQEQQTAQRNVSTLRRLGPILGLLGGVVVAAGSFLPWAVVNPGGGFGLAVRARGGLSAVVPILGVVLVAQSMASMRSGRNLRIVQLAIGVVVIGAVVLVYSGPLLEELARQMLPSDRFVLGVGLKAAVLGAVLAILGAIATTSGLRDRSR
jgi:hypothetical protein